MLIPPGFSISENTQDTICKGINTRVYRAVKTDENRPVILKTTANAHPSSLEVARYRHEYNILTSFKEQGLKSVVNVVDLINHDHKPYLIMEDFGGVDLKILQKANDFELKQILDVAVKIVSALGEIYQAQIIHKDIKPSNILYNPATGILKLIDFSSASIISRETPTIEGSMLLAATLPYMSPEQTGRMNRMVDWRTDYYSFGITLYELLCGRLPFRSSEAIELVHAHMAIIPEPPHEIVNSIPPVLSEIILKLMAKDAEERYQSSYGIEYDLKQCRDRRLSSSGKIEEFVIGLKDISDRLQIPQKLYGRETEIKTLLAGFEQASQGACKMLLVTGPAGIGKSALVHEVQRPLSQAAPGNGATKTGKRYFISGKFDQLQKSTPYAPLIHAFQELIRQILSESDAQIAIWKEKLLKALGPNGQVIIAVIPEVELIIGKQPEVPELGLVENINRFNYVFENFISTFAAKDHTLVIFLDDLQWADSASLKLIEMFMMVKTEYLYLIGTYRDNEVDLTHPLTVTINEIKASGADVEDIRLSLLEKTHVNQLIAETFSCALENSKSLAGLCFKKTQGNPFFLGQFIHFLYQEKLVEFSGAKGEWQWSDNRIKQTNITDNVVDLMTNKIQKLSADTGYILSLAACIGNRFDLHTLSLVYGKPVQETADDLFAALQEELVLPLDESYKYVEISSQSPVQSLASAPDSEDKTESSVYRFLHDRIQQAAYSLINKKQRAEAHLKIGREILKAVRDEDLEEHIFDIVDQLNLSSGLITNISEREKLAQLNLLAGKKAKLSAAFHPAADYLKFGIEMLQEKSWQTQYDLTLSLYEEAAEAAFFCSDFAEMEALVERVSQNAKNVLDMVKVYDVKIQAYTLQHELLDAVKAGLHILKLLGVNFPEKPNKLHLLSAYLRTKVALFGKQPDNLIDLPEMIDPFKLAQMRMLMSMAQPAYFAASEIVPLVCLKGINLSIKYGNTPASIYFYNTYGMVLCGYIGDINSGFEFGKLAERLAIKLNVKSFAASTLSMFNGFVKHWKRPLRETIKPFETGVQKGLETGDFVNVGACAYGCSVYAYLAGIELAVLKQKILENDVVIKKIKDQIFFLVNERRRQTILNLMGYNDDPTILTSDIFDEKKALKIYQKQNNRSGIAGLFTDKLILCYLFYDYDRAVANVANAEKYIIALTSTASFSVFHFYDSLALLALFPEKPKTKQKSILRKVSKNQKKMKKWAHHAPMNYLHKWQLVEAEKARVLGKDRNAIASLYDLAIAGAKENLFIQEEALANELAARFYLEKGETGSAEKYMKEARYCYEHWGAKAKVDHLDEKYPELLGNVSASATQKSINNKEGEASRSTDRSAVSLLTSKPMKDERLDLTSVMKASQVISGEIEIEKLLTNMMRIIIENAGAEKGCLILRSDDNLLVEAEGNINQENIQVLQAESIENSAKVPESIIHYVARIKENIVLKDATNQGEFITDPYIVEHRPKSLLCAPLIHQNNLSGIIYLENNLTTGAFTKERLEVLPLLCSQAAISLENANLYKQQQDYAKTLEEKVAERTVELKQSLETIKQTQEQLIQSEKMAAIGSLVAGVAHEVNTPIGIAVSAASHLEDKTLEFVEKVAAKTLKRSDVDKYTKTAANSSNLILKNLSSAVKIVQGFKQVAVDQTSGKRREFKLKDYIEDVLLSLQPKLKKTKHEVKVSCPEDLTLNSFPGAFSQIISNLVMNSLIHGFEGIEIGEMVFEATENKDDESILFTYRDNGRGMDEKALNKIFEPFFTTKRSQGGSGLGMHIVNNLVTQTLGGTITCQSEPQKGITVIIKIQSTTTEKSHDS